MTPRRLDPDSVTQKLELMRDALDVLEQVGPVDDERLRDDRIVRGAVERYLMLLVDQAVAVNLHLSGALGGETRRDYASSFRAAADVGVVPDELAGRLLGSVGLRNVLAHEYVQVDLGLVAAAVPRTVEEYGAYVRAVASFLRDRPED